MEQLLFAARKLVVSMRSGDDPEGHHPDLTIPEALAGIPTLEQYLEIQPIPGKGQGFVAKRNLPAGTLLLVDKPIALVLDSEEEEASGYQQQQQQQQQQAQSLVFPPSTPGPANGYIQEVRAQDWMEDDEDDDNGNDGFSDVEDGDDDDEDDDEDPTSPVDGTDDKDPHLNELLLLEVLDQLNSSPNLWHEQLSNLFPRTEEDVSKLPAWVCHDDEIFVEYENGFKELERQHESLRPMVKDISKRLPLILRYNILSVETCPELLSYSGPEGFSKLSGIGLYYLPSFFNHSRSPNCARFAIGDVMCFVTNQNVASGTEVCISYIEHDVLCESAYRRNLMLSMNFREVDHRDHHDEEALDPTVLAAETDGPEMPVIDTDVQNELMGMDPLERLSSIDELLAQATGRKRPQEEESRGPTAQDDLEEAEAMDTSQNAANLNASSSLVSSPRWFQCDVQNLRILKAITLEGLGQARQALDLWEESIAFCDSQLPPLDEAGVPLRVQAALTCWHMGNISRAQEHATAALTTHNLLFGGGVQFFRIRMGPDFRLSLRPSIRTAHPAQNGVTDPVSALWSYV